MFGGKAKPTGIISAAATYALLAYIAITTNASTEVARDIINLLSGNAALISRQSGSLIDMLLYCIGVAVVALPWAVISGLAVVALLGNPKSSAKKPESKHANLFYKIFVVMVIEELMARWLFLGVGANIFSSTAGWYTMFLLGNTVWSLIHLFNYEVASQRNPLRVIPQFIAGCFFTVAYLKFGLFASIIAHTMYNCVLFATHRIQNTSKIDLMIVLFGATVGVIGLALLNKPLADLQLWVQDSPQFSLPGWTFGDYFKLICGLWGVSVALFGSLLYDRGNTGRANRKSITDVNIFTLVFGIPLIYAISILLIYGGYLLMGLFVDSTPIRILTLAIVLTFTQKSSSGSGMSRNFWESIPITYVTVCVIQAMSFWSALILLVARSPFDIIHMLLIEQDD